MRLVGRIRQSHTIISTHPNSACWLAPFHGQPFDADTWVPKVLTDNHALRPCMRCRRACIQCAEPNPYHVKVRRTLSHAPMNSLAMLGRTMNFVSSVKGESSFSWCPWLCSERTARLA